MKTKLYLDVDGVINAWHAHKVWDENSIRKGVAGSEGFAYDIIWSQQMVDELFSLDLELIWTTTWRQYAVLAIAPLIGYGFDSPYLTNSSTISEYDPSIVWKLDEVLAHQKANPSKFVWIDDEIDYLYMRVASSMGGLALGTDPNTGITPTHIRLIKDYIKE